MLATQPTASQQNSIPDDNPLAGSCEGRFVLTSLPAEFLESLLPPLLQLGPQNYSPAGYHPVMLMHNYTHLHSTDHLTRIAILNKLELKLDYNEFILMLPFVQFRDNTVEAGKQFCFLPVLYLDSLLAVMGGRMFWEFNKEMARFKVSETDFSVHTEILDDLYFTSTFQQDGNPVPTRSIQNFEDLKPILDLPVIEFGPEGYVTSIYKMDYETAELVPTTASVINTSCKYLPAHASIIADSIEQQVLGAFNMNYNWELSWATKIAN